MAPSKTSAVVFLCLAVSALVPFVQANAYTLPQPMYVAADDTDLPPGFIYPMAAVTAGGDIPINPAAGTVAMPGTYVDPVPYPQAYPQRAAPADFVLPPGYVMPTVDGVPPTPTKGSPAKPSPAPGPEAAPSQPAKPAKPSSPAPAAASQGAPKATAPPLSGPCSVEMNFTVCSTVGRTETYYNLKKKYEAPGHLPKLNIIAKKHEKGGYFVGEAGCSCRTEFKMVASKEVTAEDHTYYYTNLKSFFEDHVQTDNTFPCMHLGQPVYSGSGCPAPAPGTAKALPPPPVPAKAKPSVCAATLSVTVCVADKAAFMAELKREEKPLAESVDLKKKTFHKDLTFTDVDAARICPTDAKAAIKVDIAIPAATTAESDALLQPVQAIGSLLVGQKLASVVGGAEIGEPATVCS